MSREVPLSRDGSLSAVAAAEVTAAVAATVSDGLDDDAKCGLAVGEVAGGSCGVVGGVDTGADMVRGGCIDG